MAHSVLCFPAAVVDSFFHRLYGSLNLGPSGNSGGPNSKGENNGLEEKVFQEAQESASEEREEPHDLYEVVCGGQDLTVAAGALNTNCWGRSNPEHG
jgi:hypothetical protein